MSGKRKEWCGDNEGGEMVHPEVLTLSDVQKFNSDSGSDPSDCPLLCATGFPDCWLEHSLDQRQHSGEKEGAQWLGRGLVYKPVSSPLLLPPDFCSQKE